MANKHVELVKKWLADPESVSREELEANYADAGYELVYARVVEACAAATIKATEPEAEVDTWAENIKFLLKIHKELSNDD